MRDGTEVPGAIVTVDINRGRSYGSTWIKALSLTFLRGGNSNRGVDRDIVVFDSDDGRELYREGPYNGISVNVPFDRIVNEIGMIGLNEFIRRREFQHGMIGPLSEPSGSVGLGKSVTLTWQLFKDSIRGRRIQDK